MRAATPLRSVAILEAAKGALVLIAGFGLLRYAGAGVQHLADTLVRHSHLNPSSAHPRAFEHLLRNVSDTQLRIVACGALAYALLRFIEAWGLWRTRRWAEWFALATGASYLPIELYELVHTRHWAALLVFTLNAFIVAAVAYALKRRSCAGQTNARRAIDTRPASCRSTMKKPLRLLKCSPPRARRLFGRGERSMRSSPRTR